MAFSYLTKIDDEVHSSKSNTIFKLILIHLFILKGMMSLIWWLSNKILKMSTVFSHSEDNGYEVDIDKMLGDDESMHVALPSKQLN